MGKERAKEKGRVEGISVVTAIIRDRISCCMVRRRSVRRRWRLAVHRPVIFVWLNVSKSLGGSVRRNRKRRFDSERKSLFGINDARISASKKHTQDTYRCPGSS